MTTGFVLGLMIFAAGIGLIMLVIAASEERSDFGIAGISLWILSVIFSIWLYQSCDESLYKETSRTQLEVFTVEGSEWTIDAKEHLENQAINLNKKFGKSMANYTVWRVEYDGYWSASLWHKPCYKIELKEKE